MEESARHIALLAPVPLAHLLDGRDVCQREGRVAFGSRAWEVFRKLDAERLSSAVDVYIYASHQTGRGHETSWSARYVGHCDSVGGAHPAGMRYRPPSTGMSPSDNEGHWAIFWEVEDLQEVGAEGRHALRSFTPFGKRRPYGRQFVPEGPLLVEHP